MENIKAELLHAVNADVGILNSIWGFGIPSYALIYLAQNLLL
jgi:hypothetical protein